MSVRIQKISTNMYDYVDVIGNLNLENNKLNFQINLTDYKVIFPIDPRITADKINFFVIDDNDKKYSCIGCVTGFKFGSQIKIEIVSIDLIFENFIGRDENLMTNQIVFETSYPRHYMYNCYIKDFEVKYTSTKILSIKKEVDEQYIRINLTIDCKTTTKREKLDDLLYGVLEIIFLIFGCIPKLDKYKFKYNNKEVILHFNLADKYIQNLKSGSNDDALLLIDKSSLTKDLIKRFIKFRKNTSILFDMFLINSNTNNYNEITNSMLIQLIEGTYKTLTKDAKKELWEILDYYFIKNKGTNMLLNKKDLKSAKDVHNTPIFLYKAKEHRHYLSHLNMNEKKKVFYQLENNYAKFKLILCLRLIYMEYLDIKVDKNMLNKIIKSIDDWGTRHKIKI